MNFSQEDLENTLKSAAREQNKLNPTMRKGDIQVQTTMIPFYVWPVVSEDSPWFIFQVATLEDVIKEMKVSARVTVEDGIFLILHAMYLFRKSRLNKIILQENSTSNWDDVIFIPPGFDVSDDSNEQ